jgi:ribonuclease E
MDERRNNRLVERRLKEALRNDRARIQVGRISHFGLLEMSRQRLRTGMLEGSTKPCPVCQGTGMVRSVESVALDILRSIEDRLITDGVVPLVATTAVDVALYILNQKRAHLNDIQMRYRIPITVTADENMHVSQFVIERAAEGEIADGGGTVVHMDWAHHHEAPPTVLAAPAPAAHSHAVEGDGEQRGQRSRRRRRRGRRSEGGEGQRPSQPHAHAHPAPREPEDEARDQRDDSSSEEPKGVTAKEEGGAQARKGPRRRGRRGGRRGRSGQQQGRSPGEGAPAEASAAAREDGERGQNGAGRKSRSEETPDAKPPHREAERVFETVATEPSPAEPHVEPQGEPETPRRRGWWQR